MTCFSILAASSPEGRLPRAQEREHRLAGGGLEDVDGLEAVRVVMGVEQRQLLAAVDGIGGIVDVEGDAGGNTLEACEEQIDHRQPHARQRRAHDGAFSRRDRVGWLIRSRPLSGRRPQASSNAGSTRKTSRSSQSS